MCASSNSAALETQEAEAGVSEKIGFFPILSSLLKKNLQKIVTKCFAIIFMTERKTGTKPRWSMKAWVTVLLNWFFLSNIYVLKEYGEINILWVFFSSSDRIFVDLYHDSSSQLYMYLFLKPCDREKLSTLYIEREQIQTMDSWTTQSQRKCAGAVRNTLRRPCCPNHLSVGIFLVHMMNTSITMAELGLTPV